MTNKKLLEVYRNIHNEDIEKRRKLIVKLYNLFFNRNEKHFLHTIEYEVIRVLEEEILTRIKEGKIRTREPEKNCNTCLHVMKSMYSRECSKCYLNFEGYEENISLRRWEECD